MKEQTTTLQRHQLVTSGRRAADTIGAIVSDKDDVVPIETNSGSLRSIATLLAGLSTEVTRCGGSECFGRSVEGVRLWVTQDRLAAVESQLQIVSQRLGLFEAALSGIANAAPVEMPEYALLQDWHDVAMNQSSLAKQALSKAAAPKLQ